MQSDDVRSAISLAMGFWFSNDFTNPACLDSGGDDACPCGTPGLWNTNWFANVSSPHIRVCDALTQTLFIPQIIGVPHGFPEVADRIQAEAMAVENKSRTVGDPDIVWGVGCESCLTLSSGWVPTVSFD